MARHVRFWTGGVAVAAVLLATAAAEAHTGGGHGFVLGQGFFHPLGGLDHILAMLAVGLWAAQLGGRAVLLVPAAFLAAMLAGAALAGEGVALPLVQPGILGSVIVLGALLALQARLPRLAGFALVGLFALLHGHAHGSEAPAGALPLLYALGFAAATALLQAAGIGLATALRPLLAGAGLRLAGGAIAAAGLALVLG